MSDFGYAFFNNQTTLINVQSFAIKKYDLNANIITN